MFNATFESLQNYKCPDWFADAKFGIWSHWGPQSVPMFGDWYARHMYIQDSEQYLYHVRHYGHPSKFGWKDVCALWKAENFDPEGLMDLFYKAGARYFVAQAMHHDNFFNYDSDVNRFNSTKIGPMKDICMLWKNAAKKYNMPFGMTEHLAASFSWWKTNKFHDTYGPYKDVPYDGNDPLFRDFYYDNYEHVTAEQETSLKQWYTQNAEFQRYWLEAIKEVIDKYTPELLYSDGVIPFGKPWNTTDEGVSEVGHPDYNIGLEAIAHFYNKSIEVNGENQGVYLQKDKRPEIFNVGLLDIEKSQLNDIAEKPWQTDTCIGGWFYDARQKYKKPDQIIEMLVDIISKNGCMLLNILQKPDGTIDEEATYILNELSSWFKICGDAVYSTRPWKISSEGDTKVFISGFTENKTNWNSSDFRFTKKENKVFAFMFVPPYNGVAILKSFVNEKVQNVKLLGFGDVEFKQDFGILNIKLPNELPTKYINCFEIIV